MAAGVRIPHLAAHTAGPSLWHAHDIYLPVDVGFPPHLSATQEWSVFWSRLVNIAGLTMATILIWVPVRSSLPDSERPGRATRPAMGQAAVVALVVGSLVLLGTAIPGGYWGGNPATEPLFGPTGFGRDALVATFAGGAVLWLVVVWAVGPPLARLAESAERRVVITVAAVTWVSRCGGNR